MNHELVNRIRNNFQKASKKYKFDIISPYTIECDGVDKIIFAMIPFNKDINGILISLLFPPDYSSDEEVISFANKNNFKYSFINIELYQFYNDELFCETLIDWGLIEPNT